MQSAEDGEVNWIIETKGRFWEGTEAKDEAMIDWCARISEATGERWRYERVNQIDFDARRPKSLRDIEEWRQQRQGKLSI